MSKRYQIRIFTLADLLKRPVPEYPCRLLKCEPLIFCLTGSVNPFADVADIHFLGKFFRESLVSVSLIPPYPVMDVHGNKPCVKLFSCACEKRQKGDGISATRKADDDLFTAFYQFFFLEIL